jgi:hypothetical protein
MVTLFSIQELFLEHYGHKSCLGGSFWKLSSDSQFWTFLKMSIFHFGRRLLDFFENPI